jgi:N-methylhydantoinase A/oxoprolinase/acetone carboxylase beta subunit
VTDADVLLGYVPADHFLGGEIALDTEAARRAMQQVAQPLGLSVEAAAGADRTSIKYDMGDEITVEAGRSGHNVRDIALVAGGGAGPVHAAFIADLLHMPQVVIPPIAATYSAFGMFAMDVGRNFARSYITRARDLDIERVNELYAEMEREAIEGFSSLDVDVAGITFLRTADVRYVGQFHEVEVPVPAGLIDAAAMERAIEGFHGRHEQLYNSNMPWQQVELLTFRLRATTPKAPFEMRRIDAGGPDASAAHKRTRRAWFDGQEVDTSVYDGALLRAGNEFHGPAMIEEATTTVVVPSRYAVRVDEYRNYVMTRDRTEAAPRAIEAQTVGGAV